MKFIKNIYLMSGFKIFKCKDENVKVQEENKREYL